MKYLPWLRRAAALAVLAAIAPLFLAESGLAIWLAIAQPVTWPQFTPSLIKFCQQPAVASGGWLAVIVLTFFCGRIYCSALCPLGIVQDGISRLSRRKRRRFSLPQNFWRYGILTFTIITFAIGGGLTLRLLDPFSAFGRIMNQLCRPIILALRWLAAKCFEYFDIYLVAAPAWPAPELFSFVVALLTLALVAWLAARHGRLYCNSICPVGTLLAICGRRAFFRPNFHAPACTACRRCEAACKANCLDARGGQVDMSRCVVCFNCLAACPEGALRWSLVYSKADGGGEVHPPENVRESSPQPASRTASRSARRALLGGIGAALAALLVGSKRIQAAPDMARAIVHPEKPTTIPEKRSCPVSPPGSLGIAHFTAACTACQLCVAVCPGRVLSPSLFEFGVGSMMQPRLDFSSGYCTFECVNCLDACPAGAIVSRPLAEKKRIQIGVAQFIKDNCVVHTEGTACGACSEHCPTKAVDMVPYPHPVKNNLKIPEIKAEYCLGCGACEHACPTRPYRAIFVDGNPIHKQAKKPDFKPLAAPLDDGGFPF